MTEYAEVGSDRDVAVFLAQQLHVINIWKLPLAAWVAREDGKIVAILALTNVDYPAIHLFKASPNARVFMRIFKLWEMAKGWMIARNFPVVAAPVAPHLYHFQSILRKLGFEKVGVEKDTVGNVVEVIYMHRLGGTPS